MLKITLKQLQYFVVVAEQKSFAAAAKTLNISQPAITSAVSLLEERLEVELVLRHHAQGVTLTTAGQDLLVRSRSLLIHAKELEINTIDLSEKLHGRLNIGCFPTLSPMYMPKLITNFLNKHNEVDVRLFEGKQKELINGLKNGEYDYVFMYHVDSTHAFDKDLEHYSLQRSAPHIIVSPKNRLSSFKNISLKQLINFPMVLLDIEPSNEYFLGLFREKNLNPLIKYRSPSFETVRGFVASDMGYSILITQPKLNYDYNGNPIKYIPIKDKVELGNISLTQLQNRRASRLMKSFYEFTINNFIS
jgi:DNA-binding transcriptional LysR family regulator|tara:strand:- start:6687 stop:7598 length:912 start_codon:yes stop_codon:yes gene_type:complete